MGGGGGTMWPPRVGWGGVGVGFGGVGCGGEVGRGL